jgi:hypothetical protein
MFDPAVEEGLRYPLWVLAFLAIGFSLLVLATTWRSIPQSVPSHFGISGRPDRWNGRWVLFLLLAVQAGTMASLLLATGNDLLFAWCMAVTSILMSYVIWGTIQVAQQRAERLNPFVLYGLVALLVIPPMLKGVLTGK